MKYYIINGVPKEYNYVTETLISHTESKHIALATPQQIASEFEKRSAAVNYKYCYMSNQGDFNAFAVAKYIYAMHTSDFNRPAKYVLTSDGKIWADNTHTSILHLYKFKEDVKIKQTLFYIVDTRSEYPQIILEAKNINPIHYPAIAKNALALENRIKLGWRPRSICYTLKNLCDYDHYLEMLHEINCSAIKG